MVVEICTHLQYCYGFDQYMSVVILSWTSRRHRAFISTTSQHVRYTLNLYRH